MNLLEGGANSETKSNRAYARRWVGQVFAQTLVLTSASFIQIWSGDGEEHRQRARHRQQGFIIKMADRSADLVPFHGHAQRNEREDCETPLHSHAKGQDKLM